MAKVSVAHMVNNVIQDRDEERLPRITWVGPKYSPRHPYEEEAGKIPPPRGEVAATTQAETGVLQPPELAEARPRRSPEPPEGAGPCRPQ